MFSRTGIAEPKLDTGAMTALSSAYGTLATALTSANLTSAGCVRHVQASNDGPAAKAFTASEGGVGSITHHLQDLAAAATRTKDAYSNAARDGGSAAGSMYILAAERDRQFWEAFFSGADPATLSVFVQVVRGELQKLEAKGVAGIQAAFANLNLPATFATKNADVYGRLDPGITKKWQELYDEDPEKIKAILQKMADDYARANGFDPVKIDFTNIPSKPGSVTYGDYSHDSGRLRVNINYLDDPQIAINTVIHEMEHRRQYTGMGFRWPWEDTKAGMSKDEAERWKQLNSNDVRNKGGDPDSYWPRPIEVGARDAGRDYVNNLSEKDLEKYL